MSINQLTRSQTIATAETVRILRDRHGQLELRNLEAPMTRTGPVLGAGTYGQVSVMTLSMPDGVLNVAGKEATLEGARKALKLELDATQNWNHPNVVKYYGYWGNVDAPTGIVMELCSSSLYDRLRCQALSNPQMIRVLRQLLSALETAAEENVCHRDIKPDNLMVCDLSDGTFDIKVADWGLAVRQYRLCGVAGTPTYMPPEAIEAQRSGRLLNASPTLDTFAAGITALELHANRTVWQACNGDVDVFLWHVKHRTLVHAMQLAGYLHRAPDQRCMELIDMLLDPDQSVRPYPTDALNWLQDNTVEDMHGEAAWLPSDSNASQGSVATTALVGSSNHGSTYHYSVGAIPAPEPFMLGMAAPPTPTPTAPPTPTPVTGNPGADGSRNNLSSVAQTTDEEPDEVFLGAFWSLNDFPDFMASETEDEPDEVFLLPGLF